MRTTYRVTYMSNSYDLLCEGDFQEALTAFALNQDIKFYASWSSVGDRDVFLKDDRGEVIHIKKM